MKQMISLIHINRNFRRSVNLQLDLGDNERIATYIPTRSSVTILERYFAAIMGKKKENATILIGPYGKGKSHLLLVLMSLLCGTLKEQVPLLEKIIKNAGEDSVTYIQRATKQGKKYLPVLINPIAEQDLNQSFMMSLREALFREKLGHIAPDSYYSEAIKVIENWRKHYPDAYRGLKHLVQQRSTMSEFKKNLRLQNRETLEFFMEKYPELTAGSVFAPMLQMNAVKIYQQVGRVLTEEYGYDGIYIVFDEFSKYIEGHAPEGFSKDMHILQEMCELANDSGQGLFLTLVAHKSIHEYVKGIPADVKNAFRGVEGRLTEIQFVVSAQNDYELIADAIIKTEPEFSEQYMKLRENSEYCSLMEESWNLPCFRKTFMREEFWEMIAKGCFPFVPLFSYALIHISEQIAQNERTIFTFLADGGQGSFMWLLQKGQEKLIGIDKIYDYFRSLFRETADVPYIHNEWMKAETALAKTADETERAVIKALAIIRMIRKEEELPAKEKTIRLALALEETECREAICSLKKKEVIAWRSSLGVYAFRDRVGVNTEKEITKKMSEYANKDILCHVLQEVLDMKYELPRQYNQTYAITRFFQYAYFRAEDFLKLKTADYLFEENFSDGKMIMLLGSCSREEVQKHLEQLQDERIIVLVTEKQISLEALAAKYQAVLALKKDEKFIDGNKLLLLELDLYEEDIAFEINAKIEEAYLPENKNVWIFRMDKEPVKIQTAAGFSSMLSEICEFYYGFSPKVNHELLNIQNIGPQYLRARNIVVKKILEGSDCTEYQKGTSPEAMVYRSAFVHTKADLGCQKVFYEIDCFFEECISKKAKFEKLYDRLLGKNYGMRKGIIPLFLAKKLGDMDTAAVIYSGKHEMEMDCETLNKVNESPQNYELYLELETAEKERYLQQLQDLFGIEQSYLLSKQKRICSIASGMQNWYRSLPQYTRMTMDFEDIIVKKIKWMRNSLKLAEINPRELIFDKFPEELGNGSYAECIVNIKNCKYLLEQKLGEQKNGLAEKVKGIFGASKTDSLKACLTDWYENYAVSLQGYIWGTQANSLVKYIAQLDTNDEGQIVAQMSKIVIDIYMEDWRDNTAEVFLSELTDIKEQVEETKNQNDKSGKHSRIILKDAAGNEITKYYDAGMKDSTSMYLKNMMSEALEEFGDTLAKNQKVAVLVEMLEELLQ